MIHLRTFGPPMVANGTARPVVVPTKPLALLVYLAAARPRGPRRRDELLAFFYPEADARHGRSALRQLLLELRASAGTDTLRALDREQLQINEDVVDCDLWTFEDALARGDLAQAVATCGGPFLAGFHVSGCPGFEDWVSAECGRLHRACAGALEQLAVAAEAHGDPAAAARWWRQLVEREPLGAHATLGLMRALAASGDQAGALAAAEEHGWRLHEELGADPSAEVEAFAARLRAATPPLSLSASAAVPTPERDVPRGPEPPAFPTARRPRRSLVLLVAAAAVALATAGWFGGSLVARKQRATAGMAVPLSAYRVAVFPFEVEAAPDRLYLGDAVAGLLGDAIDGVGELRRVDQQAVVEQVSRLGGDRLDLADARRLARRLGARQYVLGTVSDLGPGIRVSASLYDVEAGQTQVAAERRDGDPARVGELAATLAHALLTHVPLGPSARLQDIAPLRAANPKALREYLKGESFVWRALPDSAEAHLLAAVALDSTFALAWYRLAAATSDKDVRLAAFSNDQAMRWASRLSDHDRALVGINQARMHGDGLRTVQLARRAVDAFPASAEAWSSLAQAHVWYSWQWGGAPQNARPFFQRALEADPFHYGALLGLTWLALLDRDWTTADSLVRLRQAHGVHPDVSDTAMMVIRAMEGDHDRRWQRFLGDIAAGSTDQIFGVGVNAFRFVDRLDAVTQVFALAADSSTRSSRTVAQAHWWIGNVALAGGRWRDGSAAFGSAERLEPSIAVSQRATAAALPFLARAPEELRALGETIARLPPEPPGGVAVPEDRSTWGGTPPELARHWRAHLLGLLSARLGDEAAALGYAAELERAREPADSAGLLADLALEIRALAAAHAGREAEALAALERMGMRIAFHAQPRLSGLYRRPLARFLRAELLLRAGRLDEALGWLAWFGTWSTDALFMSPVLLRRAQIHERLGHPEDALLNYRRFAARWRDADPEYQPLVRFADSRIRRLETQRGE